MRKRPIWLLVFLFLTLAIMSPEERNNNPVNSITKAELKDHVYYLASDFLEGRLTGSEGYRQAAYYVAS